MIDVAAHAEGAAIKVRAQPGARRDAILGERGGALRIAVTAAPERGKANEAVAAMLADALQCRRSAISLLSGPTSRDKTFLVAGMTPDEVRPRLP